MISLYGPKNDDWLLKLDKSDLATFARNQAKTVGYFIPSEFLNPIKYSDCDKVTFLKFVRSLVSEHADDEISNTEKLRALVKEQAARLSNLIFQDVTNITETLFTNTKLDAVFVDKLKRKLKVLGACFDSVAKVYATNIDSKATGDLIELEHGSSPMTSKEENLDNSKLMLESTNMHDDDIELQIAFINDLDDEYVSSDEGITAKYFERVQNRNVEFGCSTKRVVASPLVEDTKISDLQMRNTLQSVITPVRNQIRSIHYRTNTDDFRTRK